MRCSGVGWTCVSMRCSTFPARCTSLSLSRFHSCRAPMLQASRATLSMPSLKQRCHCTLRQLRLSVPSLLLPPQTWEVCAGLGAVHVFVGNGVLDWLVSWLDPWALLSWFLWHAGGQRTLGHDTWFKSHPPPPVLDAATTEELKFLEGLNTTLADQYTASHGSLRAVAEFSASLLDTRTLCHRGPAIGTEKG